MPNLGPTELLIVVLLFMAAPVVLVALLRFVSWLIVRRLPHP